VQWIMGILIFCPLPATNVFPLCHLNTFSRYNLYNIVYIIVFLRLNQCSISVTRNITHRLSYTFIQNPVNNFTYSNFVQCTACLICCVCTLKKTTCMVKWWHCMNKIFYRERREEFNVYVHRNLHMVTRACQIKWCSHIWGWLEHILWIEWLNGVYMLGYSVLKFRVFSCEIIFYD
jgi:hypothetical protein